MIDTVSHAILAFDPGFPRILYHVTVLQYMRLIQQLPGADRLSIHH